eukprot:gnl/TRDRNA2_/TRDRNA2_153386_c0_seq2.p1 gnl/TRDRNA2_/TRDRNA2_153386_c0~~gnl/TRDRNA2_/TRDRNA2_153386_c0_seq2.p1  ORF type:complete len:111 (+),score=15.25 gnl/TRDRNA2_/TRDRNA2_153386_c0_seq2:94-426(+)
MKDSPQDHLQLHLACQNLASLTSAEPAYREMAVNAGITILALNAVRDNEQANYPVQADCLELVEALSADAGVHRILVESGTAQAMRALMRRQSSNDRIQASGQSLLRVLT